MRVGQNPAKSIDHVAQPANVTVAVVTYIPFLSGYYEQSLDVLKVCLNSICQHTPQPFDLMVFDNASCQEVRRYLMEAQQQGQIQYLTLSDKNVGKGGAWNLIFQGAPGEIIAYADSDVYFSSGWLERTLEILDTFPNVGMVTARPLRTPEEFSTSTLTWGEQTPDVQFEKGRFLAWEVLREHTSSLGMSHQQAEQEFQTRFDYRMIYQGVTAYSGAAHFQFTARKKVLQPFFPIPMDRPMGQVRTLDRKVNDSGYLRLTTSEPLTKHMGNCLPAEVSANLPQKTPETSNRRLVDLPPIRRSLLWLYNRIFRLYYGR